MTPVARLNRRWAAGAAVAALIALPVSAARAERVPFVGCAADGQTGPVDAPARGRTPDLPPAQARRLAFYQSRDLGILAPRGWHCFGLYGSDGAILAVSPGDFGEPALTRGFRLRGPAIVLRFSYGDTSGRFEVARAIFRLFPARLAFARRVAAEGIAGPELRAPLAATDRIVRRSATMIDFTTPAHRMGLGTEGRLAPDDSPVTGSVRLVPLSAPSLLQLDMRLGPGMEIERRAILSAFHGGWHGTLTSWP